MQTVADNFRHSEQVPRRVAVVTMGVKLGNEQRGYTRFRKIAQMLSDAGFQVDLITSTFQHWEKAQRTIDDPCYRGLDYRIVFIEEPGYTKNLDLARIRSHAQAARNIRAHFASDAGRYDAIYAEIPPNDVALACAQAAQAQGIPFIADINDLWPEAMRMALDIPLISDVAFYPFTRDAHKVYNLLTAAVGTSDEYALRPQKDRTTPYPHITVYVGNDLAQFDADAARYGDEIEKPSNQVWVTYAGTIGASYDIETLVQAAALTKDAYPQVRYKVLGDGPDFERLSDLARKTKVPADFLGYVDYPHMAAMLMKSDIVVNSLIRSAPQSIVTKIGDYLASGHPMINTGSSPEFRHKVETDGFGVNVPAEDAEALAAAVEKLACNASMRKIMGAKGRAIAEKQFDQSHAYLEIVHLVKTLI